MGRKFLLFFAIFSNLLAQAQKDKYIIFQPDFLTGKDYILEILTNEHQITKRSKEIHPSIDFYKIKMRKDHVINGEIFYTFEVMEKQHNHTRDRKITSQYNPLKKLKSNLKQMKQENILLLPI